MPGKIYTVEELMLDDSFLSYCLYEKNPEKEFWERELAANTDQSSVFAEARYTIILLHGKLHEDEVNRQVQKIRNLVDGQAKKKSPGKELPASFLLNPELNQKPSGQKSPKRFSRPYVSFAIIALVLVFAGGFLVRYATSKPILLQPESITVVNKSGTGERKTIRLPDGSVAVINSNSSLSYTSNFNQSKRVIMLTGEAFFQVAKNPKKPFIVQSGPFSVTAIGTAFYVYAGNKSRDYTVDLLEGKVKLASNENKSTGTVIPETILLPGEEGSWQPSKISFLKTSYDSTVLKKWINGKLSFKNMAVDKVLKLLEQWYGVNIIVKHKEWAKLTLTGDYDNKPLDHVLKIICFSLSAGYSYAGNQVIIE